METHASTSINNTASGTTTDTSVSLAYDNTIQANAGASVSNDYAGAMFFSENKSRINK